MWLIGKMVIVMGGGLGFGEGIVKIYVCEGVNVVVNDLNGVVVECVVSEIVFVGGKVIVVVGDVLKEDDWCMLLQVVFDDFYVVQIVVNNVGIMYCNKFVFDVMEVEFDCVYEVNMKSLFWCV